MMLPTGPIEAQARRTNKLREALGEDANNPRFVETLTRRGYRFNGPVGDKTRLHKPGPDAVRAIAFSVGAVVAVLGALFSLNVAGLRNRLMRTAREPAIQIHSIAVLPLENLSADPEQEYFAEGMTDELITELSKISALRVIARTSAMRYRGTRKPLTEIARELNVDAVVEGSVLRSDNLVRVNVRLVAASTQRNLWAQTYERDLGNVLSLQDEVARAIMTQIKIKPTPQEKVRLGAAKPVNPRTYDLYLRGRYLLNRRTGEDMMKGVDYFEQAVKIDPNYAPAYAGIADSYVLLQLYDSLPSATACQNAKAAARKAVTLDESLADGHTSLAEILLSCEWNWPAAEKGFRLAIELNPNYAIAHHSTDGF